jgi:SAM-dependent MidA family methyltransferase
MTLAPARVDLPRPSADAAAHSERVLRRIADEIARADGWIGFDRFMDLALYAPALGYYTAGARKIGNSLSGGDFVTAPEISPLFGHALAVQVAQVLAQIAPPGRGRIVEFGAGTGRLANDVLTALAQSGMTVESYDIVEVSPDLRARQVEALAGWPVRWLEVPPREIDGVILANEVLDVMPVQLFVKRGQAVYERGVTLHDGRLAFAERPATQVLGEVVQAIEGEVGTFPDGYASEVGFVARAWTSQLANTLARGAALLIDYGFPRREYYHPQRAMGTIMCHYRHRSHADPFRLPGLNDITAHVDWSATAAAAHAGGLEVLGYTTQGRFLTNCGLLDLLAADATAARSGAVLRLLSEAEMGELVKVLALGRGIEAPLCGFVRGDRSDRL